MKILGIIDDVNADAASIEDGENTGGNL